MSRRKRPYQRRPVSVTFQEALMQIGGLAATFISQPEIWPVFFEWIASVNDLEPEASESLRSDLLHFLGGASSVSFTRGGSIPMTTISGRMTPRHPAIEIKHDVRIYARKGGTLYAECEPCNWTLWLDGGHNAADFQRLEREHSGVEPKPLDDLTRLTLAELVGNRIEAFTEDQRGVLFWRLVYGQPEMVSDTIEWLESRRWQL
jgi:hypothetical protein